MNYRITLLNSRISPWDVRLPYRFPDENDEGTTGEESIEDEEDEEEDDEDEDDDDDDGGEKEEDSKGSAEEVSLARVDYGTIKEKFPTFFKEFPDLKHAFFREQQFTEIFPTIEDAKKAADAELAFEEVRNAVMEGDVSKFLEELGSESKEGAEAFSKNFLPALRESNEALYFDTVAPVVRGYIKQVFNYGIKQKDDNVKNSAKIVHKLLFGGDYGDVEKEEEGFVRANGGKKEPDKVDKDKEKFYLEKYQDLYRTVTDSCYSTLEAEIGKGLEDVKKGRPGLMKIIVKDIKERVLQDMEKDKAYMGRMESLWKREQRAGFSGQLKNSLSTTFLAKAKALIPKHRSEVRREVLGKEPVNGSGKEPNRLTGNKTSADSGKGKMTAERARKEGLTARQVFDS